MLRLVVLLLLLANGLYFAWTRGLLAPVGWVPATQSEPARLDNQIKPNAMRLLSNTEAYRIEQTSTALTKPPECLQSPLLDDTTANAVRAAAALLPDGSWQLESAQQPARWIVYMGKYQDADSLDKKKSELRLLRIAYEPLVNKSLEPGISLGGHETKAQAEQELAEVGRRGVRTARVVQEVPGARGQLLRLPVVDDALRTQLAPIRLALGATVLGICKS